MALSAVIITPLQRRWRLIAWSALVVVAGLSLAPLSAPPQTPSGSDKLVHVAMYAALMFCHGRGWPSRRWPLIALTLAGFGVGMECLQHFLPLRSASLADALANSLGVSIMLLDLRCRHARHHRTEPQLLEYTDQDTD